MTPRQSICEDCGAPIYFARCRTGNDMPVDIDKSDRGNVLLAVSPDGRIKAKVHAKPVEGGRCCHWYTCPNAHLRKNKGGKK